MRKIYTSIDLGTDSIKIVVCELLNGKLNLLAASSVKSEGITKGIITDFNDAATSLKKGLAEIESLLGVRIREAIVSVPSYSAEFKPVKGVATLDRTKPINSNDITNVFISAANRYPKLEMEMVTMVPITFGIDGKAGIKDPKTLFGDELEVHAIMISVPKKNIADIVTLFRQVNVEIIDISINGIGSYYAFRDKEYDTKIGAIIDIGKETITTTIVNKGIVVNNNVIELGSRMIEKDLAYVFKIGLDDALVLKEKFALAHKKNAIQNEIFNLEYANQEELVIINQLEASEVVMSRIEEMLSIAKRDINIMTNNSFDYVIITGGGSNMKSLSDLSLEIFGNCAIIGEVKLIGIRNNKFASAVGNIVYFITKLRLRDEEYSSFTEEDLEAISLIKKDKVTNDTMLGKVFGYFFNNEEDK